MQLILRIFISKCIDQFMISGAILCKRETKRNKTDTLYSRNLKDEFNKVDKIPPQSALWRLSRNVNRRYLGW